MLRKSGILAVLLALAIFGALSASTSPPSAGLALAPASASSAPSGQAGVAATLPFLSSENVGDASCSASPLLAIGDMGRHNLDTCVDSGGVCDPRIVHGAVCCPGLHCQFRVLGGTLYCL